MGRKGLRCSQEVGTQVLRADCAPGQGQEVTVQHTVIDVASLPRACLTSRKFKCFRGHPGNASQTEKNQMSRSVFHFASLDYQADTQEESFIVTEMNSAARWPMVIHMRLRVGVSSRTWRSPSLHGAVLTQLQSWWPGDNAGSPREPKLGFVHVLHNSPRKTCLQSIQQNKPSGSSSRSTGERPGEWRQRIMPTSNRKTADQRPVSFGSKSRTLATTSPDGALRFIQTITPSNRSPPKKVAKLCSGRIPSFDRPQSHSKFRISSKPALRSPSLGSMS